MASGKRASMREGPLAALFRKTEEGQQQAAPADPPPAPPKADEEVIPDVEVVDERPPAPRTPTPQERLRHAFSSDLPDNMMAPPPSHRPGWSSRSCPRGRPGRC